MIVVLGDLLADYSIHIPRLAIEPKDLQRVSYLGLGPGGACNVAIMSSRFGLSVLAMGEVGEDLFGEIVLEGLVEEGIDVSSVAVTPGGRTPVANVLVDDRGEPAYLGFPGDLHVIALQEAWREQIRSAEALYCDGWAENKDIAGMVLDGLRTARDAGVPSFFDPGPGNPDLDNNWHAVAASMATVTLATEDEAHRLSGEDDPVNSAKALLARGCKMVVIKRGMAGCFLLRGDELHIAPGLPVIAQDATGAGDSLAASVIYGYLAGLELGPLGDLANATGAAKVRKLGTGHNMPTVEEVNAMLERFGSPVSVPV